MEPVQHKVIASEGHDLSNSAELISVLSVFISVHLWFLLYLSDRGEMVAPVPLRGEPSEQADPGRFGFGRLDKC